MARQIEGVYEAVLRCAEEEFLAKGYKDASLRTIAERAGTSTGSIYTRFAHFVDELVEIEVDYTYKYMAVIGCESVKRGIVTEEFIHIIVTAYFNGMFEVVRHEMTKEAAIKYIRLLNRYHMKGFETVFDAAGV